MIDITEIVVAVIGLLSVIVTSVVVPLIVEAHQQPVESICNMWPASRRRRSSQCAGQRSEKFAWAKGLY